MKHAIDGDCLVITATTAFEGYELATLLHDVEGVGVIDLELKASMADAGLVAVRVPLRQRAKSQGRRTGKGSDHPISAAPEPSTEAGEPREEAV